MTISSKDFNRLPAARAVSQLPARPKRRKAKAARPHRISSLADRWVGAFTVEADCPTPPIPEYRFHPSRRWRFDFAWPRSFVAVEIHGGVWAGGRHTRGKGFIGDREKMNTAQEMGWIVYEVTDVRDVDLMQRIAAQVKARAQLPGGKGAAA